jgi:hypothetical protein
MYMLLALGTCAGLYWRNLERNASPLFWLPLLALLLLQAREVINLERRDASHLVLLVVSVVLVGIVLYPYPFQLSSYDVYFDVNFAQTIVDKGRWDPTQGAGFAANYYGYYPCLYLIFSNLAIVVGLPVLSVFKYVAPVAVSVGMFAAGYFMFKRCFSDRNAALASLIYVSSLGFMAMGPSRRATALILGTLIITLLFCKPGVLGQGRSKVVTALILSGGFALSDHFTALVVLVFAASMLLILRTLRSQVAIGSALVTLLGAVIYSGWMLFVASRVLGSDVRNYGSFFAGLFTQEILVRNPTSMYGYSALESALVLSSWGVFGLLALVGLSLSIRGAENRHWRVWGLIGVVMFGVSSMVALHPVYGVASITLSWFATLLLSALASLTIVKLMVRLPRNLAKIIALFLLTIMFSGAMLSAQSARVLDRSPGEDCMVEEPRQYSFEQYALGKWIEIHSGPSSSVLGDRGSYALLSGLFGTSFVQDFSWPGRTPQPGEFKDVFVLEGNSYFLCRSTGWNYTDATLVESLGGLNRLWDGGTWRMLNAFQG